MAPAIRTVTQKCSTQLNSTMQRNITSGKGISRLELATTTAEKDLVIYTRNDLKPARQCTAAVAKASSVLGIIRRNFRSLNIENFNLLYYTTYIRPHLKYCIQAWSPHLVKDSLFRKRTEKSNTDSGGIPKQTI